MARSWLTHDAMIVSLLPMPRFLKPSCTSPRHMACVCMVVLACWGNAVTAWSAPSIRGEHRHPSGSDADLVMRAMNFIGVPYVRGGNSVDDGFDCSGFTRYLFEHSLGLVLPRRADEQARMAGLAAVPRNQLQPGDLVFFNTMQRKYSHVGVYIGDNKFVHAPRTGANVRVDNMDGHYWRQRYDGARRADGRVPTRN